MKQSIFGIIRHLLTIGAGYLGAQGLLDDGSSNELIAALMAVVGIGWSVWEKHKVKIDLGSVGALLMTFGLITLTVPAITLQTGCSTMDPGLNQGFKDTVKNVSKAGVIVLLKGTKEAQPYLPQLVAGIDAAYANNDSPGDIARAIGLVIASSGMEYANQQLLIALLGAELTAPPPDDGTTAGPPGQRAFDLELAAALELPPPLRVQDTEMQP